MSPGWRCPLNRGVPKETFHCVLLSNLPASLHYEINTHENPVKSFIVNSRVFQRFSGDFNGRIVMGFSRKNTMNMA